MTMLLFSILACGWRTPTDPVPTILLVKRGDTLGELAKSHGVTVEQLKRWNDLTSDRIDVGQALEVYSNTDLSRPAKTTKRRRHRGLRTAPEQPHPAALSTTGPQVPTLSMPRAKPCIALPNGDALGEQAMVTSQGLSHDQVQGAMNRFLPKVRSCLAGFEAPPQQPLNLSITVGCDGRVQRIRIGDQGDWPDAHAACLRTALRHVPFPAHGLPDGDTFQYPLRMQ